MDGLGPIAKIHPFNERLSEAQSWEQKVLGEVANILVVKAVRQATRREQKDGIDFIANLARGTFDVKFRDYKYYEKGILLETVSVVEDNVKGWFYTSKADAVVYFWWNENRTALLPITCFVFIRDNRLREWFEENKHRYKPFRTRTEKDGRTYHTEFVVIPKEDFPKGTVVCLPFRLADVGRQSNLNGFIKRA